MLVEARASLELDHLLEASSPELKFADLAGGQWTKRAVILFQVKYMLPIVDLQQICNRHAVHPAFLNDLAPTVLPGLA